MFVFYVLHIVSAVCSILADFVCRCIFVFVLFVCFFSIFVIVHVRFVFGAYCDMSAEAILGEFVKVVK